MKGSSNTPQHIRISWLQVITLYLVILTLDDINLFDIMQSIQGCPERFTHRNTLIKRIPEGD